MIKENRIKNKLTQEELAELLEITPRHMQRIEKDENKTKISTLKKAIKTLKIPDEDILKFMKN